MQPTIIAIMLFTLHKDFGWKTIEIDDLIPCDSNGGILFAKNSAADAFWVPLIEKGLSIYNYITNFTHITSQHTRSFIIATKMLKPA
jgi:hypothetical protein